MMDATRRCIKLQELAAKAYEESQKEEPFAGMYEAHVPIPSRRQRVITAQLAAKGFHELMWSSLSSLIG